MNIIPVSSVASHKQGTLINQTPESIATKLGFKCNVKDDPYKVKYSWAFKVGTETLASVKIPFAGNLKLVDRGNEVECAVWDWKGSARLGEFSFYGPREVFEALFGADCVR